MSNNAASLLVQCGRARSSRRYSKRGERCITEPCARTRASNKAESVVKKKRAIYDAGKRRGRVISEAKRGQLSSAASPVRCG